MRRSFLYAVVAMLLLGVGAGAYAKPPRHAPAHGYRQKARVRVVRTVYTPAPFIYLGTTYVPLRTATSLVGAALLWNSLDGRALITFNGKELGLVIGSPSVLIGGETVVLREPPIIVRDVVYVPAQFCETYLEVPVRRSGSVIRLEGHGGWREYRVAPRPPGTVIRRVGAARPVRIQSAPGQGRQRVAVGRVKPQQAHGRTAQAAGAAKKRGGGKEVKVQGGAPGRVKGGGGGGKQVKGEGGAPGRVKGGGGGGKQVKGEGGAPGRAKGGGGGQGKGKGKG